MFRLDARRHKVVTLFIDQKYLEALDGEHQ